MTRRAAALAVLTAAGVLLLGGCGGGDGGTFDDGGEAAPACLRHQPTTPGSAYTAGEGQDTGQILRVLRYYTANGRKPYCDGRAATSNDRRWATLYVEFGADRANVAPLLGPA